MKNNRQIKFRVWDNRNKNWVGGPFEAKFLNNSEYSVCQFTGLKDKNGREIYEGDVIVKIYDSSGGAVGATNKFEVVWQEQQCGYGITAGNKHSYLILGNIFETLS